MTIKQACEFLGVSHTTLNKYMRAKKFTYVKEFNNYIDIDEESIKAFKAKKLAELNK